VEDFDGDIRGWHAVWGALEHSIDISTDILAHICGIVKDIDIAWNGKIVLELGFINLCNCPNTKGLFLEFFKYLMEWSSIEGGFDYSFRGVERMRRGV
jgi:hypothetical protein